MNDKQNKTNNIYSNKINTVTNSVKLPLKESSNNKIEYSLKQSDREKLYSNSNKNLNHDSNSPNGVFVLDGNNCEIHKTITLNAKNNEDQIKDNNIRNNYCIKKSYDNISESINKIDVINNETNKNINKLEFTIKDYEKMNLEQEIKYDKRSNIHYYWDHLKFNHLVISAFIVKRNSVPQFIRVISLLFFISFQFALNAIFFTDSYISQKNDLDSKLNSFEYTLLYQFSKSIWSLLIAIIPIIIFKPILKVPNRVYNAYNNKLLENKPQRALEAYKIFKDKMSKWYFLYIFLTLIIHLFSWYYVTVFCGVYTKSSINWFFGGIITMIIKFVISTPLISFIRLIVRIFVRHYPNK